MQVIFFIYKIVKVNDRSEKKTYLFGRRMAVGNTICSHQNANILRELIPNLQRSSQKFKWSIGRGVFDEVGFYITYQIIIKHRMWLFWKASYHHIFDIEQTTSVV